MSFIPVIWKNKLYLWIPSLIFGVLVVISNYFVQWLVMSNYYARMTQYILKVLMYIFMIPSLIRYNLFVLVFQYMILSSVNIAYIALGIQMDIERMFDLYELIIVQSYLGPVFVALEITFQMFRRRMACFK